MLEPGQRKGLWTLIKYNQDSPQRHRTWQCRCDCGTVADVRSANLSDGRSRSCGCTRAALKKAALAGLSGGRL